MYHVRSSVKFLSIDFTYLFVVSGSVCVFCPGWNKLAEKYIDHEIFEGIKYQKWMDSVCAYSFIHIHLIFGLSKVLNACISRNFQAGWLWYLGAAIAAKYVGMSLGNDFRFYLLVKQKSIPIQFLPPIPFPGY